MRKLSWFVLAMFALVAAVAMGKEKQDGMKLVDSGTFDIIQNGENVATETFRIEQGSTQSTVSSEIRSTDTQNTTFSSELQVASNGNLLKYTWRQSKPEHQEFTLEPQEQTLIQHYSTGDKKQASYPYLLPPSTSVLDDYFFIQREVLAWKYIASQCQQLQGCKLPSASMGIVVPHDHNSEAVKLTYKGMEKVTYKGAPVELSHFVLNMDDMDWSLYLDGSLKMVLLEEPSNGLQVVRQ